MRPVRRMAVFPCQLTRSWTRPASREACCRAAVKPRPTGISPYAPARIARSLGSRGTAPCASREACCRAAVKPRPTGMSPYAPARLRRAVRLGALPLAPDVEAGQGTLELGFGNAERARSLRSRDAQAAPPLPAGRAGHAPASISSAHSKVVAMTQHLRRQRQSDHARR